MCVTEFSHRHDSHFKERKTRHPSDEGAVRFRRRSDFSVWRRKLSAVLEPVRWLVDMCGSCGPLMVQLNYTALFR